MTGLRKTTAWHATEPLGVFERLAAGSVIDLETHGGRYRILGPAKRGGRCKASGGLLTQRGRFTVKTPANCCIPWSPPFPSVNSSESGPYRPHRKRCLKPGQCVSIPVYAD